MVSNFYFISNSIKPRWKFENQITLCGDNIMGLGYDYGKTKKITTKTEKGSPQ